MDPLNSETWKQEWTAFWSAPWIVGPLLLIVGAAVWWLNRKMSEAQIAGLREQISTADQRLKFANERMLASERVLEEVKKQVQDYKAEVASKGNNASSVKMDAALEQLKRDYALLKGAWESLQRELDYGDVGYYRTLARGGPGRGLEAMKKDQLMKKNDQT